MSAVYSESLAGGVAGFGGSSPVLFNSRALLFGHVNQAGTCF